MTTDVYFRNFSGEFDITTDTTNWLASDCYKIHTTTIGNCFSNILPSYGRTEWISFNRDSGVKNGKNYELIARFSIGMIKCELSISLKGTAFGSDIGLKLTCTTGLTVQTIEKFSSGEKELNVEALFFDGSKSTYKFKVKYKTIIASFDDLYIWIEPVNFSDGDAWGFTDHVNATRTSALGTAKSQKSFISELVTDVQTSNPGDVIYAAVQNHDQLPKQIYRPEMRFAISADGYDYFFNGVSGYRASYYSHPIAGREMNREILDALETLLISKVPGGLFGKLTKAQATECLGFSQAKIWIHETAGLLGCGGESEIDVEIFNLRAQQNKDPLDPNECKSPQNTMCKPVWGTYAPRGVALEVKGGWMDISTGKEWLNPGKKERATEIAYQGFS